MTDNAEAGGRRSGRVEGVLDPDRAEAAGTVMVGRAAAARPDASWRWPLALLLALLFHLIILALVQRVHVEPPRTEAFEVQIVTLGNTQSEASNGPADGADDPDSSATMPDPDSKAARNQPPEGEKPAETPPPPDAPVAALPPTPPPPIPVPATKPKPPVAAPKPARPAPPKVVETPAPPRAANPPLAEAVPGPQARLPDLRYDVPEAHPQTAPQDPGYASLPPHVSARLGAMGGGPVWQKGPPPKDSGMVPWGSDYWARMKAWVQDHGRYPPEAAPRRLEGEALLEFVIDRSGKLLTYRVLKSSGYFVLDAEVKRMITWSDPLPPLPPDYPGETMHIIVPVVFEVYS